MRTSVTLGITTVCFVCAFHLARADERTAVDRIVTKAIEAAGGKEKLSGVKATTWKTRTVLHDPKKGIVETVGVFCMQGPDHYRAETTQTLKGKRVEKVVVVNGANRWVKEDGRTRALSARAYAEVKGRNYAIIIANTPTILRNPALRLSLAGEIDVRDRPAVGLKITFSPFEDLTMYYDKVNGLPLKSEMTTRKPGGAESTLETVFGSHTSVGGITIPFKAAASRDGEPVAEVEVLEVKFHRSELDEKLFARP